jgi:hypothetical protein
MSDDEDLIGDIPPKRGRPSNAAIAERERKRREAVEAGLQASMLAKQGRPALGDPFVIQNGVNVTWLCQAFRQDIKTVRRKLANVEPIGIGPRGVEVYDFASAASYLAKPPPDQLAQFLKGLRVQDLPIQLQEPYWGAMRKRQIYMEHARHTWKDEDVLEVLAEVFKTQKSTMQLWVDTLAEDIVLTDEQRAALTRLVDSLQEELYSKLVELPKLRRTVSEADAPEANPSSPASVEMQDDDEEDLVG